MKERKVSAIVGLTVIVWLIPYPQFLQSPMLTPNPDTRDIQERAGAILLRRF
jgi:hypothetical protein